MDCTDYIFNLKFTIFLSNWLNQTTNSEYKSRIETWILEKIDWEKRSSKFKALQWRFLSPESCFNFSCFNSDNSSVEMVISITIAFSFSFRTFNEQFQVAVLVRTKLLKWRLFLLISANYFMDFLSQWCFTRIWATSSAKSSATRSLGLLRCVFFVFSSCDLFFLFNFVVATVYMRVMLQYFRY